MPFLEDLLGMLGPQAAEARGPTELDIARFQAQQQAQQQRMLMEQQRMQQLQQFRQQQMQSQQQRQAEQRSLQERGMQLREQQARAKQPSTEPLESSLTKILGQTQVGPRGYEEPIFYGAKTPGGPGVFTNIPTEYQPIEPGPEVPSNIAEIAKRYNIQAQRAREGRPPISPLGAPGAQPVAQQRAQQADVSTIARAAEMSQMLKGRGMPADVITQAINSTFPQLKETERRAKQLEKQEEFIFQNQGSFFNKKTGEPLSSAAEMPGVEEVRKGYVRLQASQLPNKYALDDLDRQVSLYDQTMRDLQLSPNPYTNWFDIKRRRAMADPVVRRLDSARAGITQIARAFGGDSRVSDKEMEILQNIVLRDFESPESAQEAIQELRNFRDSKARSLGFTEYRAPGAPSTPTTSTAPSTQPQAPGAPRTSQAPSRPIEAVSKSGKPIVSDDGGRTWRYKSGRQSSSY